MSTGAWITDVDISCDSHGKESFVTNKRHDECALLLTFGSGRIGTTFGIGIIGMLSLGGSTRGRSADIKGFGRMMRGS